MKGNLALTCEGKATKTERKAKTQTESLGAHLTVEAETET